MICVEETDQRREYSIDGMALLHLERYAATEAFEFLTRFGAERTIPLIHRYRADESVRGSVGRVFKFLSDTPRHYDPMYVWSALAGVLAAFVLIGMQILLQTRQLR